MTIDIDNVLENIRDMRNDDKYKFADTILAGIEETIIRTQQVTPRQFQAITNIHQSANRTADAGWKRRYEGYQKS